MLKISFFDQALRLLTLSFCTILVVQTLGIHFHKIFFWQRENQSDYPFVLSPKLLRNSDYCCLMALPFTILDTFHPQVEIWLKPETFWRQIQNYLLHCHPKLKSTYYFAILEFRQEGLDARSIGALHPDLLIPTPVKVIPSVACATHSVRPVVLIGAFLYPPSPFLVRRLLSI